ncbi:hypothetical protein MHU86_12013 [Fragilaria crotonensis]|nr:hypothetical protein MHU86_12013 [Fragilaria crotonensis]
MPTAQIMSTTTDHMSPVPSPIYIHSSSDVGPGRVQPVIKRKRHDETSTSNQLTNESKIFGSEERQLYAQVDKHPLVHKVSRAGDGGSTSTDYSDTGSSSDGDEEKSQLETSYLEPIHDPKPLLKKSKIHRVASMSQLPSHLSADQFLPENTMSVASMSQLVSRMNKSRSTPSLPSMIEGRADILSPSHLDQINPDSHLHSMLKSMGVASQTYAALDLKDYFIQTTAAHTSAYGSDVLRAVRERDFSALRKMHLAGRTLQCCNTFGESILHMACRHGDLEVVRFLVNEAGVSFRVRDDFGRTPLHDAFWTQKPEIELVKFILSSCPDLLLLKDKRGFTPLAYARRSHWGEWCEFLQENYNLLIPHEL